MGLNHRDRFARGVAEKTKRAAENCPCSSSAAEAVDEDALSTHHAFGRESRGEHDAVPFGSFVHGSVTGREIFERDLLGHERARVVIARMKPNESAKTEPMKR